MAETLQLHSLYVGDLHPGVTEGQLIDTFSGIKDFVSASLCKDTLTGFSRGYGYLNFSTFEQAMETIETMNHTLINGKPIRLMWSQCDSEARRSGIGNVFVKNLASSVDNMKLHGIFTEFGTILSCKVQTSQDGESKGYGFVQFESAESAQSAIQELNGQVIEGKEIYVGPFIKKSDRINSSTEYNNLYVKNFDQNVTEETLGEKFSVFGTITSLVISKDSNGVSKGFGFVSFENSDDAKRAKEAMDGAQLGANVLYVAKAQKKGERKQMLELQYEERRKEKIQKYKDANVFIKNINDDVDDSQLKAYFGECGLIVSAKIMRTEKGISRGFGFVCFSTPHEAQRAIRSLNGVFFHGKPLYVALAQTKEERRKLFQRLQRATTASIPAKYPTHGYIGQHPMNPFFNLGTNWRPCGPQTPLFPTIPNFRGEYEWRNHGQAHPIGYGGGVMPTLHMPRNLQAAAYPFMNPGYHHQRLGRHFNMANGHQ
ncbi:hypothetical protein SLE2022_005100 [Rubroshorea leprosula]